MSTTTWRDVKYTEIFEDTMRGLYLRLQKDPSFTKEELDGIIKHLYVMDGNDQYGRGEIQDLAIQASIAAHEQFREEWKRL